MIITTSMPKANPATRVAIDFMNGIHDDPAFQKT
jgi:hypothetical protein